MKEMQRKIRNLTKTQEEFQKRIKIFNAKIQQTSKTERNETIIQTEKQPLSRIIETERLVLNLLVEKSSMTASKMVKKIGKTREHTSRLMKKLWKIERDSQRKPFTYRATKKLIKETLEKKIEKDYPESLRMYKHSLKRS